MNSSLAILAIVLLSAQGCGDSKRGGIGARCIFNADCEAALYCGASTGTCQAACNGPSDCPTGQTCVPMGTTRLCQALPPDAGRDSGAPDSSIADAQPEADASGSQNDSGEASAEDATADASDAADETALDASDDAAFDAADETALDASTDATALDASDESPDTTGRDGADGVSCTKDPRVDPYVPNSTKGGQEGALAFTLVESIPAPPALGSNVLLVKVTRPDGTAFVGDLRATIRMPDHTHPSSVQPMVFADGATGRYSINGTYFFMAGVWRVQLSAYASADAGVALDTGVYYLCVE